MRWSTARHFWLTVLFFSLVSAACAQSTLTFLITDKNTRQPVSFCAVMVQGVNAFAQSNDFGVVRISVNEGDTLIIHHLGYHRLKIPVMAVTAAQHTVQLIPRSIALDEVNVTYKSIDTFMPRNNTTFIDFEFYNDDILALANKGQRKNSLMLVDVNGNRLAERQLSVRSDDIFRDCFGNLHLLTADSVYQVFYNYRELVVMPGYPIRSYYSLLAPCECNHGSKFVFKLREYQELKNKYVMHDSRTGEKSELACIADSVAINGFNLDHDIMYFLNLRRKGKGYGTSVTELTKNIDVLRAQLELPAAYKNLLRPVRSQLVKTDTSFMIMDFTNKFVHHFNLRGKQTAKYVMPETEGWSEKLYMDNDAHKYYFVTSVQGKLKIALYDPLTNMLTHKAEVSGFHFLPHFVFHDGHVYFLYRSAGAGFGHKIMRYRLSWEKAGYQVKR